MINCKTVTAMYSESLERPLTLKENIAVNTHAMLCSGCRNFGKQMLLLRRITRAYVKDAERVTGADEEQ